MAAPLLAAGRPDQRRHPLRGRSRGAETVAAVACLAALWLWPCVAAVAPTRAAPARPPNSVAARLMEGECTQLVCVGGESKYERQNCASKCVSPSCFARHYAASPLEDGEVDEARRARFLACAEAELRNEAARVRWSGRANVSPEEAARSDSRWAPS